MYSNCGHISHCFLDIPTYCPFSHHLPPLFGTPIRGEDVGVKQRPLVMKSRMMGLSRGKRISTKHLAVLIESTRMTDRETERQTDTHRHTITHMQPFYSSLDFVWDNPGEPVPAETFTTHTYRGHQSSLICFLYLLRSIASSLFNVCEWQSFCTTSLQVCANYIRIINYHTHVTNKVQSTQTFVSRYCSIR